MNHNLSHLVAVLTTENKKLLCIVKNLTGIKNKMQNKPNINPNWYHWNAGITLGIDTPAKHVQSVCQDTKRKQPEPIPWVGAKQVNQKQTNDDMNQQG